MSESKVLSVLETFITYAACDQNIFLHREFPGGSEIDLDPSLQDGMPPKTDLNRYSRDYYVAGNNIVARNRNHFPSHQKQSQEHSPTSKQHHLTNGCQTLPNTSQQVIRNGQVCHTVPCMHVQASCMSSGGDEDSDVPPSQPEASTSGVCASTSQYSSPLSPTLSICSVEHVSGNISNITATSKAHENLLVESGKVHSSIIDKFNKGRVASPSSSLTQKPTRSVQQGGRLSSTTLSTPPNTLCSSGGKVRQSVNQSPSSSTLSSPFSRLVTPLLPESPGIGELEGNLIHHSLTRLSFRSRQATREFSLNPLFEDEAKAKGGDSVETHHSQRGIPHTLTTPQPSEPSSDYYSSYESLPYLSSFSREGSLKLPKPQVTEEIFESLSDMGGSLRLQKNKSPLKSWGSFKHKRSMMF